MAAYDLEEQEQLSAIKAWWEKNGGRITGVAVAVALVVLAVQGWRFYQNRQAAEASALFGAVTMADQAGDTARLKVLANEIASKHGGSVSAELSAMLAAHAEFAAGEAKAARERLEQAAGKGDTLLRDVARLRLAAVQADAKEYDAALKTLEAAPATDFLARFEDLRGDVLFAKGDREGALAAYRKAWTAAGSTAHTPFASYLQTKLEALGGA